MALDAVTSAALTTVSVAVFLAAGWLLMLRPLRDRILDAVLIGAALFAMAVTLTPTPIQLTAAVMVTTVVVVVVRGVRIRSTSTATPPYRILKRELLHCVMADKPYVLGDR